MTARLPLLAVGVVLVSAALLAAQEEPRYVQHPPQYTPPSPAFPFEPRQDRMYEDVEIFRRILDRKLQPLYPRALYPHNVGGMQGGFGALGSPMGGMGGMSGMGMMGMQGGMMGNPTANFLLHQQPANAQSQELFTMHLQEVVSSTLEGVYLEGRGVVYTATVSSLRSPGKSDLSRPVSEWERARREVCNEKEEPRKTEAGKKTELSEVLLAILAENGHHFSQLAENESLTIVLTLHAPSAPAPAAKSEDKWAKTQKNKPAANAEATAQVRDLELLGDLHQKQGHYEEAIKVFTRALALQHGNAAPALYRKLAQCHLALGQDDKARADLERLSALVKDADAKEKTPPPSKLPAALPVKLIVSAPKRLLDQVGDGKIKLEDFRRQASVKMLTFGERHSRP